jgi:hypothetical protein
MKRIEKRRETLRRKMIDNEEKKNTSVRMKGIRKT